MKGRNVDLQRENLIFHQNPLINKMEGGRVLLLLLTLFVKRRWCNLLRNFVSVFFKEIFLQQVLLTVFF